jgi:small ligand-binding sensory domain FIST
LGESARAVVAESVSAHEDTAVAITEVIEEVREAIGRGPDLVTVFFSPHHRSKVRVILDSIQQELMPGHLVGSSMAGVVGGGREMQAGPGIALWAARLPGTEVFTYHLELEEEKSRIIGWPDMPESASTALIAEPFSFPLEPFFISLRTLADLPVILGGIASGADRRGENVMLFDHAITTEGAVGFVLDGSFRLEPVVAQGCRPVGPQFKVTRCEGNVMLELGGRPAYGELSEVLIAIGEEERQKFMRAPHVGIQPLTNRSGEPGRDMLVRGVMGVDPDAGAVAVTDQVGEGMSVQFQARDREAAHAELSGALELSGSFCPRVLGALQFSCTGRGIQLFQRADHDVGTIHDYWPDLPVSGAFVAGEIGPVCGLPYIHGLATCVALLVENE